MLPDPTMPTRPRSRAPARRYASARTAAALYDLNPKTIRAWAAAGRIRSWRLGTHAMRVDLNEIERELLTEIESRRAAQ
jgi:predicted site-specific integrase-resolvase